MSLDPYPNLRPGISDVGKALLPITPGPSNFPTASLIYARTAGDVTYIPLNNPDATTVTETVTQGWISPVLVRRVTAATASLSQILTN